MRYSHNHARRRALGLIAAGGLLAGGLAAAAPAQAGPATAALAAKPGATSCTTTGAVDISSETMTGLFKGAFPKRIRPKKIRGRAMPVFYDRALVATSVNSLWLRCVAAPPISDPLP